MQRLSQVDEVQVERKMPNEIDITVTERKPIAWITSEKTVANPFASDAAFLIDARGILMKEKKLLPEYLALPLITGCSSEALVPGKVVDSFEAKAALELLRLTTTSFMQTRFQIREVDVSKGYCLLVTDKNHTRVMFGFDHLDTSDAAARAVSRLQRRFASRNRDRQSARRAQHPGDFRATVSAIISELEAEPGRQSRPNRELASKEAKPVRRNRKSAKQRPFIRRQKRRFPTVRA